MIAAASEFGKSYEQMTQEDKAIFVTHLNRPDPKLDKAIAKRDALWKRAGYKAPETEEEPAEEGDAAFPISLVKSAREFSVTPVRMFSEIVTSLFWAPALVMIFAQRGLGKTHLAMALVNAICRGNSFLAWQVPIAQRCLYIDGELPGADLQAIVRDMCGIESPELLDLMPSEIFHAQEGHLLNLNDPVQQKRFLLLLEELEKLGRRPTTIVIDNYSSVSFGSDENSNTEQEVFLEFLIDLRHRGYLVILIHHAGKSGEQRGASRREDFLDVVVKLSPPDRPSPNGNAKFILSFSKFRRKMPVPAELECELVQSPDGGLVWSYSAAEHEVEAWIKCLQVVDRIRPDTQDQIAEAMGIGKATVSKHLAKAREKELLDGLTVTRSGERYLDAVFGGNRGPQ